LVRGWNALAGLAVLAVLAFAENAAAAPNLGRGAVFVMTNEPSGNSILVFRQNPNGRLTPAGSVSTGGLGNGTMPDSLQSQGSLVRSGNFLFAVNAGSNEISVLSIGKKNLTLVDKVSSGGLLPTSLAVFDDLLYVVNVGSGEITGFRIGSDGQLTPLAGSTQTLTVGPSTPMDGPSQVSFTPNGEALLVTEKGPAVIDVFRVGDDGLIDGPFPAPSNGQGPFGFAFSRRGHLVVSETNGGPPNEGSASSYTLADDGTPSVVSGSIGNGQFATCWVVITGPYAYMTNTVSGTISRYRVGNDGSLTLQQAVAASTGGNPIDMALSAGNQYLYTIVDGAGALRVYRIEDNGSLTAVRGVSGIPPFSQGIVAQ
jgi:6-phosphogluconolactonase (cycloisomerase 2 family)